MTTEPCKFADPVADPDADLMIDVQNMDCGRRLRQQVYELQDEIKAARQ
jgi:hypothetical protein